jgi:hypothetical protein
VGFGLCDSCRHQQIVRNSRGSVFTLCRRSRTDPGYPRYPRVPVLACRGHEPDAREGEQRDGERAASGGRAAPDPRQPLAAERRERRVEPDSDEFDDPVPDPL